MRMIVLGALTAVLLAVLAANYGFEEKKGVILSPVGEFRLNTELPKAPAKVPIYRVVGDESKVWSSGEMRKPDSLPNVEEAIKIALNAIDVDKKELRLAFAKTEYVKTINTKTGEVVKEEPLLVNVKFERILNGMPVVGPGGEIQVLIGDGGKILTFVKIWRKLEYAGEVSVIPAEKALEKLKRGEVMNRPMASLKLDIEKVELGYYAEGLGKKQDFYKPVWIFRCKDELGNPVVLAVNAVE